MILAQSTTDDIRRLHDIWVARLAFEYRCERDDVLAVIQPRPAAQAPVAPAPAVAPAVAPAEVVPSTPSADPLPDHSPDAGNMVEATPPQPTSTPAVQAHGVEPSSEELDDLSNLDAGSETAADPAPVSAAPASDPAKPTDPLAKHAAEGALSSEPGGVQDGKPVHPAKPIRGRPDSTRAKVVAVHKANPSWPSKLIAQHLGITEDSVRATASRKKLKLVSWWDYERAQAAAKAAELRAAVQPQPKPVEAVEPVDEADAPEVEPAPPAGKPVPKKTKPPTLGQRIAAIRAEHPDWPFRVVAKHLGVPKTSVQPYASMLGFTWPSQAEYDAAQAAATALANAAPPEPEPQTPATPEPATALALVEPPPATTAPYRIAPKIARAAPQGRFYLRDQAGQFVHQSLLPSPTGLGPLMTKDRKWGWYDTMQRYRGAKAKWPQLAFMTKDTVQP